MKENTGPRSRYGKVLIKALARRWHCLDEDGVMGELQDLHNDFKEADFKPQKKTDEFYRRTVEGLLGHLQEVRTPDQIQEFRLLSKNLVNPDLAKDAPPEDVDLSWLDDDDISMGGLFDNAPEQETSDLLRELIDYVERVQSVWEYNKPFFFKRSTKDRDVLLVVTSVGAHSTSITKTNVNVAIGSSKLPEIGEEFLVYEHGSPVKWGLDGEDGRTYWGWAFKIKDGTTLRFWMSKVIREDQGNEIWDQRAKVLIRLNTLKKRGYHLLSAKHEDRVHGT